jgi:hypothetical protein
MSTRDTPTDQKTRANKKRPLRCRSGQVQGGNAQEGRRLRGRIRNTALQQYDGTRFPVQAKKYAFGRNYPIKTSDFTVFLADFPASGFNLGNCAAQ